MEEKQETKRKKSLERELEWVRMSPKARQSKGKARLNAYDKLINEEVKEKEATLELYIPPGPRLGDASLLNDELILNKPPPALNPADAWENAVSEITISKRKRKPIQTNLTATIP